MYAQNVSIIRKNISIIIKPNIQAKYMFVFKTEKGLSKQTFRLNVTTRLLRLFRGIQLKLLNFI